MIMERWFCLWHFIFGSNDQRPLLFISCAETDDQVPQLSELRWIKILFRSSYVFTAASFPFFLDIYGNDFSDDAVIERGAWILICVRRHEAMQRTRTKNRLKCKASYRWTSVIMTFVCAIRQSYDGQTIENTKHVCND